MVKKDEYSMICPYIKETHRENTHSQEALDPIFRVRFVKKQNNSRDGLKVMHGLLVW